MRWRSALGLDRRQEDNSYTDQVVGAAVAAASGSSTSASSIAAAEVAAGAWGRAFMGALVAPDTPVTAAVTADTLELIGRSLVMSGEAVFRITATGDGFGLEPASSYTILGEPDPASWVYRLECPGPTRSMSRTVPAEGVVHVRYAAAPGRPWAGRSPLAIAPSTAGLAATLEAQLKHSVSGPVGSLLPVPDPAETDVASKLPTLNGRVVLVPTGASGWANPENRPRQDWQPTRIGPDVPPSLVDLRGQAARSVLGACGVPVELVDLADGTGQREAWRRFLWGTIAPVGRKVVTELRAKLEEPDLDLDWSDLRASDLAGRARAWGSFIAAGMDPVRADRLSGLS